MNVCTAHSRIHTLLGQRHLHGLYKIQLPIVLGHNIEPVNKRSSLLITRPNVVNQLVRPRDVKESSIVLPAIVSKELPSVHSRIVGVQPFHTLAIILFAWSTRESHHAKDEQNPVH